MSRNLMVLFLFMAVICVTVMSHPPPEQCEPPPPPPPPPCRHHPRPHHPRPHPHPRPTPPPPTHKPSPPPPRCPKNEIFKLCGTACQPSCRNPYPICNKVCVKGCFCIDGLLRNKRGKCVEPCNC